ncbi:cupin [Streptomyces pluripotens]|uniref:Cupin n=1 Tax=Streptomyces pluripotens TaxID=1355015 RepID=A0A221P286_9ACTN|nr:cupin domain-containing protein [Streptomyces pluripotens]ARP72063.1 hypothetical protein LK06_021290 [Streptomyces pluripotens]ASN26310.1 cupin [Streptomyces pluripotens]
MGTQSGQPGRVTVVGPSERRPGPPTPGMERQEAFATQDMWSGLIRTAPGMVSGWHHHGDYDTVVYVLSGRVKIDFGAGGADSVTGRPGDFIRVPRDTVHREGNPSAEPAEALVLRVGKGPSTFNVEGPAS